MFWHSASPTVEAAAYEQALLAFHRALIQERPDGLLASRVLRFEALPWLPSNRDVYEDTYLVAGSAALDVLDQTVVAEALSEHHSGVARLADRGTAGLYRLRRGSWRTPAPRFAQWFAKPAGERYESLYAGFDPYPPGTFELWGRQMVLGPTPEFCWRSELPLEVNGDLEVQTVIANEVWSFEC